MHFRRIHGGMSAVSRTQGRRGVEIDVRIRVLSFCYAWPAPNVEVVQKEACKWRTDIDLKVSSMKSPTLGKNRNNS